MKLRRALLALAVWAVVAIPSALAQSTNTPNTIRLDSESESPPASIESVAWLAGAWEGRGSFGAAREVWMAPSDGTMAGAFKAEMGDSYFYEFVEISESGGSLVLKVKHFDPALKGWEERDEFVSFPLVRTGDREVFFSGLTYRLTSDDQLRAFVAISGEDGVEEIEFTFRRVDPKPSPSHTRRLEKEVLIRAPIGEVWNAWTTEEGLAHISGASRIELAVGGPYEWFVDLPADPQGKRGGEGNRVLAYLPGELLAFDWNFPPDVPELRAAGARTQVIVRFDDVGDSTTRVRFAQHGWKSGKPWDAGFAYFDRAWDGVLEKMRTHLEESAY